MSLWKLGLIFIVLALLVAKKYASISDTNEVLALEAIKQGIGDGFNWLDNWHGADPCGNNWKGIICATYNGIQYVTELRLLNMNFTGTIAPEIGNLSQLVIIDFMWNNLTGSIPLEIGRLRNLYFLLLNGNKLTGTLPSELGNLANLNRLQIDQNYISGPIPTSFQFLNQAKHFHMNNNSLNGTIPAELGRLENLVHLLLDNNNLSGKLPSKLWNISTLLILQLDNNHFSGPIPSTYSNMKTLTKLSMRNCNLSGPIPDLSMMTSLRYLDLSHNMLQDQLPPNVSEMVTTIDLSFNQIQGEIPAQYYGLNSLEFLLLRNNSLDGNVLANLIAHDGFTTGDSIVVFDFQDNNITGFTSGGILSVPNVTLRLYGNPVCNDPATLATVYCSPHEGTDTNVSVPSTTILLPSDCTATTCDENNNLELVYGLLTLGFCHCAYPLFVGYRLKSPGFAIFPPYEEGFLVYLSSGLNLSLYQVNVSDYNWTPGPRLIMNVKLFPKNTTSQFTGDEVAHLYDTFATWNIPYNKIFGPYEMLSFTAGYPYNGDAISTTSRSKSSLSKGAIIGLVLGTMAILGVTIVASVLTLIRQKHRHATHSRAARHDKSLKVAGVKDFTYAEMANATRNFDASMQIGQGGYGKVYKGTLADGLEVAIKRADGDTVQGSKEFYTEIDLLSRVHHRNLVSLVGYCDDEDEEMVVYEFMANGTLRDHLYSISRPPLDFATRLQIALGSARGILYLHTEANPPIFHRDIKTSNILLDKMRRAKVADFGLSKLAPVAEVEGAAGGEVSTLVKGTPGYLDPEYFLTQKLTDKSDVYSFGVVLLELITGMQPISQGKYLVREVHMARDAGMIITLVDPRMGTFPSECLQPLVQLALSCCREHTDLRPSMSEVVHELEAIWHLIPWPDSVVLKESSGIEAGLHGDNPYVSSQDIDGSAPLMSGVVAR